MLNEIQEMYQDMLDRYGVYDPDIADILGPNGIRGLEDDEEDGEEFITSTEIAKTKQKMEEKLGPLPKHVEIEEDVHFKHYAKRRQHKYTESEMKAIRESCMETIVHDYGENDIYHISDEERAKNDMLAELSIKLGTLKSTYRKIDEYVDAMRVVIQAWKMLAKHNYVHTEEEFYQMVADGKIVSNRIIMPKLKNMNSYNTDMIVKYISNPELDPTDLIPVKETKKRPIDDYIYYDDDFYDDEDIIVDEDADERTQMFRYYKAEYLYSLSKDKGFKPSEKQLEEARKYAVDELKKDEYERLLSPEEIEVILNSDDDNMPSIEVEDIKPKYIKNYDKKIDFSKKDMSKRKRLFMENLHSFLRKIQSNPANRNDSEYSRSYLITQNMFDVDHEEEDFWDDLYYDGSWTDKTSLSIYDFIVREKLMRQSPPKEHYITYADKELAKFFDVLEANGVNVVDLRRNMNFTSEDVKEEEEKRTRKENRKNEAAVLQRITKMNGDPKFKKIVSKAEEALNEYNNEGGKK